MANKNYKKGMADGARPFEEKYKKQEDAIERVGKRIEKHIDNLGNVVEEVIDELSSMQKKELFDLATPNDIAEIEVDDKHYLLAILYQLADELESSTEEQQHYIRSVQKYMDIIPTQTTIDLSKIENIGNLNTQKAFLQVIMEFLFLGNEKHVYSERQKEIIELFSINAKGIATIKNNIDTIYKATGAEGLSEKYGYVPVEQCKVDEITEQNSPSMSKSILPEIVDKIFMSARFTSQGFETQNYYVFSLITKGEFRIDKRTGEQQEIRDINIPWYEHSHYTIDGDNIVGLFGSSIQILDVEQLQKKKVALLDMDERDDHIIKADMVAFQNRERGLNLYDIKSNMTTEISIKNDKVYSEPNSLAITDDSVYFICRYLEADQSYNKQLCRYDIANRTVEKITTINGSISKVVYMQGTLYLLVGNKFYGNCSIECINLHDNKVESREILVPGGVDQIEFYDDYWIYVEKSDSLPIFAFNLRTKEVTQIATGCGVIKYTERTLFKPSEKSLKINQFRRVGDWIGYMSGEDFSRQLKVSLNEPMKVQVVINAEEEEIEDDE